MTKVMLVGDTHGDAKFTSNIHKAARAEKVETIIQLGDFGFTFDKGQMDSIYAWLDRDENHKWYWLDGNHDEHDYIEEVIIESANGDMNIPIAHFHERMLYCPRGSVTAIGSKTCMFVGGAYSIDKHYRHPHTSWWPQETIRDSDIRRAIRNGSPEAIRLGGWTDEGWTDEEEVWWSGHHRIDIMLTHDAPPSEWLEAELDRNGYKVGPESKDNRRALAHIVDSVRPKELYHGHYHSRYSAPYVTHEGWVVNVEGIGANISVRSGWQEMDPTARADFNYVIRDW